MNVAIDAIVAARRRIEDVHRGVNGYPARRVSASVLLVEDDPGVQKLVHRELLKLGLEVRLADTSAAAAKQVDDVDMVVLDLTLPDSSPDATLAWARLLRLPVLITSLHPHAEWLAAKYGFACWPKACGDVAGLARFVVAMLRDRIKAVHLVA